MNWLKGLVRMAHFTNTLVGLATALLCLQTAIILKWVFVPKWFFLLMFCSTIFQYNLHDYFTRQGTTNAKPKLAFWLRNRRQALLAMAISGAISVFLAFKLSGEQLIWMMVLGMLTLAYTFKILPFGGIKRFKDHGLIKLLVLSLVWTIATVVLPASFLPVWNKLVFWWLIVFRFFYMVAICIPFDIRDHHADARQNSATLVGWLGPKNSYLFSFYCIAFTLAMLPVGYMLGISGLILIALMLSMALTTWFVWYSSQHPYSPTSYILLDSTMIIQSVLVCVTALFP